MEDETRGIPKELPKDPLASWGEREPPWEPLGVPSDRLDEAALVSSSLPNGDAMGSSAAAAAEASEALAPKETPADAITQSVGTLDESERELWRQLRRKSEFELRVAEKRAQLAEFRDKRRSVSAACADTAASVDCLAGQVEFAKMHEREIQHDVAVLRESNRILQTAFQAKKAEKAAAQAEIAAGHIPHHLSMQDKLALKQQAREKANSIELKREQQALVEYEQITHLRAQVERLVAEKGKLQMRQQVLLDKQHAAEQDRNLLLSSLQEERKGINDLRHERLRIWEQRHSMEREMTIMVQEAHMRMLKDRAPDRYRGGVDPNIIAAEENSHIPDPFAQEFTAGKSVLAGGVRNPATLDTPVAFDSKAGDSFSWSEGRKEPRGVQRKPWERFAGDAVQRGQGVVDSGGVGFGLNALEVSAGGITEWAGRLQEFRAHSGDSSK